MHLPSPSDSLSISRARARSLAFSLSFSLSSSFLYLSSHALLRCILDRPSRCTSDSSAWIDAQTCANPWAQQTPALSTTLNPRQNSRLNQTLNKFKQVVRFGLSWRTMISHVVLWVCFKNRPKPWVLKQIGPGCLRRPFATGLCYAHCKTDLGVQTRRSCLRWCNVRGRRSLWHPQVSKHTRSIQNTFCREDIL